MIRLYCVALVKIRSKNVPTHEIGIGPNDHLDELYIEPSGWYPDKTIVFYMEVPGLSGDSDTASFKSIEDGKYICIDDGLLNLKSIEASEEFKKDATFNVTKDTFFDVSNM